MDGRTRIEKWMWKHIGPPLYYCEGCLRVVHVKEKDGVVDIKRNCDCKDVQVIAPRRAIMKGKGSAGGLAYRARVLWMQAKAKLTGRDC